MAQVDLNCDLGESFGAYTIGLDEQVIPHVTSVNIACGAHAGDPSVMRKTVRMAHDSNVAIGAHPGYTDLQGFGRRALAMKPDDVYASVLYQVAALAGFAKAEGTRLHHVKPHGALYNSAAKDLQLARAIAQAVKDFDDQLILVGLAGSESIHAAQELGLPTASEFFADRAYQNDGTLVPRGLPGAVISDERMAIERTLRAVKEGVVTSIDGTTIPIAADTICIHGDNPAAVAFAAEIHAALEAAGVNVHAMEHHG